jgi:hypothetical protein
VQRAGARQLQRARALAPAREHRHLERQQLVLRPPAQYKSRAETHVLINKGISSLNARGGSVPMEHPSKPKASQYTATQPSRAYFVTGALPRVRFSRRGRVAPPACGVGGAPG